ncbi:MAG: hypothetical protein HQL25_04770 [Candidatus Omnitrophica bacterium]|nr:hypothetical protein [Candidatus Omnitrophota bacterium]
MFTKFYHSCFIRICAFITVFTFLFSSINICSASAQVSVLMPQAGTMVNLSPVYQPAVIKGLKIDPKNPFQMSFYIDRGQDQMAADTSKAEYQKLIKYFLASLTVPEKNQWVNLSPYEGNRIIANDFGQTEMGRDLLTQDYLLKQITASLMYPEKEMGQKFWDAVYKKASEKYNTQDIPVNTFNKVWIIPDKAVVFEKDNMVWVVESHLKVMLEEDYFAMEKNKGNNQFNIASDKSDAQKSSKLSSEVVREVILPAIEKEVNEGKNFALLRQIFQSMILATWYKVALKQSILTQVYADKSKVKGVNLDEKGAIDKVYNQYVEAFKKGVYDYVKEEYDPLSQQMIPRKYFSGGFTKFDPSMLVRKKVLSPEDQQKALGRYTGGGMEPSDMLVEIDSDLVRVVPTGVGATTTGKENHTVNRDAVIAKLKDMYKFYGSVELDSIIESAVPSDFQALFTLNEEANLVVPKIENNPDAIAIMRQAQQQFEVTKLFYGKNLGDVEFSYANLEAIIKQVIPYFPEAASFLVGDNALLVERLLKDHETKEIFIGLLEDIVKRIRENNKLGSLAMAGLNLNVSNSVIIAINDTIGDLFAPENKTGVITNGDITLSKGDFVKDKIISREVRENIITFISEKVEAQVQNKTQTFDSARTIRKISRTLADKYLGKAGAIAVAAAFCFVVYVGSELINKVRAGDIYDGLPAEVQQVIQDEAKAENVDTKTVITKFVLPDAIFGNVFTLKTDKLTQEESYKARNVLERHNFSIIDQTIDASGKPNGLVIDNTNGRSGKPDGAMLTNVTRENVIDVRNRLIVEFTGSKGPGFALDIPSAFPDLKEYEIGRYVQKLSKLTEDELQAIADLTRSYNPDFRDAAAYRDLEIRLQLLIKIGYAKKKSGSEIALQYFLLQAMYNTKEGERLDVNSTFIDNANKKGIGITRESAKAFYEKLVAAKILQSAHRDEGKRLAWRVLKTYPIRYHQIYAWDDVNDAKDLEMIKERLMIFVGLADINEIISFQDTYYAVFGESLQYPRQVVIETEKQERKLIDMRDYFHMLLKGLVREILLELDDNTWIKTSDKAMVAIPKKTVDLAVDKFLSQKAQEQAIDKSIEVSFDISDVLKFLATEGIHTQSATVNDEDLDQYIVSELNKATILKNFGFNNRAWIFRPKILDSSRALQSNNPKPDQAQLRNGGIDLDSAMMNMQIRRDGNGVPLPFSQEELKRFENLEGLNAVIIHIESVSPASLPIFSGLNTAKSATAT